MTEPPKSQTPRIRYSEKRRQAHQAASYDVKYEKEIVKRASDAREKRLLTHILARSGRHQRLLDVPCGAGRLSAVMADNTERLIEADYAYPMIELAREKGAESYQPAVANVSAFDLPFGDGAVDMVVSIRLNHHIPDAVDRRRHVRELCRVSSRHVLVTFFDAHSMKNKIRNWRGKKRPKSTMSRAEVTQLAGEVGYGIAGFWRLSPLFSGHTFALLERTAS